VRTYKGRGTSSFLILAFAVFLLTHGKELRPKAVRFQHSRAQKVSQQERVWLCSHPQRLEVSAFHAGRVMTGDGLLSTVD